MLDIGLTPTGYGYKASIITAAGKGKVEYLTDSNWTTKQTLSEILKKAGYDSSNGYNPTGSSNPAGLTFKGWAKADDTSKTIINVDTDITQHNTGTSFVAVYEASYGLNTGAASPNPKVQIIAPNTGATLKDIFAAAGINATDATTGKPAGKDLAMGWKVTLPDGTEYIVSSNQINNSTGKAAETFPPGTKIAPNWVTNAEASIGGSDRTLTNLTSNGPSIGDGVTDDGKIIPKDLIGQEIAKGKTVLGYIYNVDPAKKQVKVVAKEVQSVHTWSYSTSGKVYSDDTINGKTLRGEINNVDSGFDAWMKIVGWNSTAIYGNYQAIMYAVCYPKQPTDSPINYPSLPTPNTTNTAISLTNSNDNSKIDGVVTGDGYDNRWYLPAVKELEMIYKAGDKLLNWTKTTHSSRVGGTTGITDSQTFWSVNVSKNTATYAKYVDFGILENGKPKTIEENKFGENINSKWVLHDHYILPVAEFKYEDSQVNR